MQKGWLAVLIVSITLMFANILILDPILSLFITAYVLFCVVMNLRKMFQLFFQAVPDRVDIGQIEKELL